MAKKRRVDSQGHAEEEEEAEPDQGDLPGWMQEQSWGEWFKGVYASRLYALGCFAFDVFFGLQLYYFLDSGLDWVVLPVMAFFVALQVTIYLYLWGSKGKLRS